jgi:hypothetical protein
VGHLAVLNSSRSKGSFLSVALLSAFILAALFLRSNGIPCLQLGPASSLWAARLWA